MSNDKIINTLLRPLQTLLTADQRRKDSPLQKELGKIKELLLTSLEQSHAGIFVEHHCPAMYACCAIVAEFGELDVQVKEPKPPTYCFLLKEIRDKGLLNSDAIVKRTVDELLEVYAL